MIWPYIILAYLCTFCFGLCDNLRGPLFPELLREFGVSNSVGSWFYAVGSAFAILGCWLCIRTLKKIDRIQTIYLSLGIMAVGFFGIGWSQNFLQLLTSAACAGLGMGLLGVCNNLLATIGANNIFRRRAVSGLHSTYALSSLIAPLLIAPIYTLGGSWRECFYFVASLCLLLAAFGFLFLRSENADLEKRILGEGAEEFLQKGLSKNLNHRPEGVFVLGLAMACYVYAEILMSSRIALYLRLEKSYNLAQSSLYVTGFFIFLFIGRTFFSFYHPKFKTIHQLIVFLVLSSLTVSLGLTVHEAFLMLAGLTMGPFYGLAIIYLSEAFKKSLNQAMAISISMQSIFLVAMHLGSGFLTDKIGIAGAMALGPVFLLLSGCFLVGFHRWKRV